MALRLCILAAILACARAAFPLGYAAPAAYAPAAYAPAAYGHAAVVSPAITSQHSNILRSYGNLGQVSTYSKSIDTPFSSVRKSDVRVSNPGLAYAAPAYGHGVLAAPALAHGVVGAPAYTHGVVAAPAYAHGVVAAPAYAHGVVAPKAIVGGGLLGVAYSAAPAVAHMTYSNALGLNYAW